MDDAVFSDCLSRQQNSNGKPFWDELAQKYGYETKDKLRHKFRDEKEKRGIKLEADDAPYKETTEILSNGDMVSDKLIAICSEDLKSQTSLMIAHGFDPNEWKLVSAKNNLWHGLRPNDQGRIVMYQSKITVSPRINEITIQDVEKFFNTFDYKSSRVSTVPNQYKSGEMVLEIDFADGHIGNESISFPDLKSRVEYVINDIKRRSKGMLFEKIVLVQLGDIFHMDTYNRTTTSGTQVTFSDDPKSMFDNGMELLIWMVSELSTISKVELVNIYGNHDKLSSYMLAKAVEAYFRNDENVTVDATRGVRKFRKFGVSSVAFVHGDLPKANIFDVFQKEARQLFGETLYSEVHLGHLHHEISLEKSGVIARWIPSITVPDQWHIDNGHTGSKQGVHCFIWDLENGIQDIWMIMLKGKK